MKLGIAFLSLGALLTGCGQEPAQADQTAPLPDTPPAASRFAAASIEAAKTAISAEPAVKDFLFNEERLGIEWQIAVIGDGSARHGYAEYICQLLNDHQALDPEVDVRIVDAALVEKGTDFRAASLGTVNCSSGTRLDDAPAATG